MNTKISILAIDLAKSSFQICAIGLDETILHKRALPRARLAALLTEQPSCIVAMEACGTFHHGGRVAEQDGHKVRLASAAYVNPCVNRQTDDQADAEAFVELASRPIMRFVAVKSPVTQGRAVT